MKGSVSSAAATITEHDILDKEFDCIISEREALEHGVENLWNLGEFQYLIRYEHNGIWIV